MRNTLILIASLFALLTKSSAQNTSPYWSLAGNSNSTSSSKLGTTNNISLRFYTNNKLRMIINSGGGVSIGSGSTPPSNGLYVSGNTGMGIAAPIAKLDVRATSNNTAIYANAAQGTAVNGSSFQGTGVSGSSSTGYGVRGDSPEGTGVKASGQVYGVEANGDQAGVSCFSTDGVGLNASSTNAAGITASTLNGTYAAEFNGKVFASSGYVTSDKNLKQNIHGFEDAMSIINKLKPQNYEFKNDAKYEFLHLPKGTHYGLMAQDLELVLPNLVSEGKHEIRTVKPVITVKSTANGEPLPVVAPQKETNESITIKAVNYVELIPVMIKGMQEQQTQIEKLAATNVALRNEIDDLKTLLSKITNAKPVTSSATKGEGRLSLESGELSAGTFNYALYTDDKQIDSKQMVISK